MLGALLRTALVLPFRVAAAKWPAGQQGHRDLEEGRWWKLDDEDWETVARRELLGEER